jgi:hypothetical protein
MNSVVLKVDAEFIKSQITDHTALLMLPAMQ